MTQSRLDFVLSKLVEFDNDQYEKELRRKMFGPSSSKRTANVLKCHKKAAKGYENSEYKIKLVECLNENDLLEFIFENESPSTVVTQISNDSLHKCAFTCSDGRICYHQFICTCEEQRVRLNYCHHLCAIGLDKKLRFKWDEDKSLDDDTPNDSVEAANFDMNNNDAADFNDDLNGYDTDDAPETGTLITQLKNEFSEHSPLPTIKTFGPELLNRLLLDYHADMMHTSSEQSGRYEEFCNLVMLAHKNLKLHKNSIISQISNFEIEKSKKRLIEPQARLCSKKTKI